jgi:rhodanese-related sulfurtransferase
VTAGAAALLPDKHAAIVTYCSNTACHNSEAVANLLAKQGYTNVRKYREGRECQINGVTGLDTPS